MSAYTRIQKSFDNAQSVEFDKSSKLVMISDCHRGAGSGADDFSKNQNLYYVALSHYLREGFTYIELGDGDELWKNRRYHPITQEYKHIFKLLSHLHGTGRLYMLYGNHDMDKKGAAWTEKNLGDFFPGIKIHEGLVLRHRTTGRQILLIHGHQADFFNSRMWRLAKFLVRYLWQPLELVGIQDPTNAPKSQRRRELVERFMMDWCSRNNTVIIAGHTHRPVFPREGDPPYYNDGSCVHRRYITCIEIEGDRIALVKWSVQPRQDNVLYVKRDVIDGGGLD